MSRGMTASKRHIPGCMRVYQSVLQSSDALSCFVARHFRSGVAKDNIEMMAAWETAV
jgi:hypothetical protein